MITKPMDVLANYQVRKSKKQKTAFITAVSAYAASLRYSCKVEKGSFGSRNIIIGNPEKAKYLVTAHYDTCPWMPFPNLITPCNLLVYLLYQMVLVVVIFGAAILIGAAAGALTQNSAIGASVGFVSIYVILALMLVGPANWHTANDNTSGVVTVLEIAASLPENLRDQVCFVLFDLEEVGLIGSASYHGKHKAESQNQIVLNLDCVGDGDEIVLFPSKKLRKSARKMAILRKAKAVCGKKRVTVHEKGFSMYPSDQANFPYCVGIAALHRSKWAGLWLGRIHTSRDTVLEQTNVNILRAAIISLIGNTN